MNQQVWQGSGLHAHCGLTETQNLEMAQGLLVQDLIDGLRYKQ